MCAILLRLIIDLPLPSMLNSSRLIKAVRTLLDFLYLACFTSHTNETIHRLEDSLAVFHNNKAIFIDLGVREHFNIPKLHSLSHYVSSIRQFGTTDNYNTEQSERVHIDMAKDAYHAIGGSREIGTIHHCDPKSDPCTHLLKKSRCLGIHQLRPNQYVTSFGCTARLTLLTLLVTS